MSRWAELQATKVKPGDPPRRDPRARRIVQTNFGPRAKRQFEAVLECGHKVNRRTLWRYEPGDFLICTQCPPCGGIGQRLGCQ